MREPFHKARLYITTLLVIEIIIGVMIIFITGIYHYTLTNFLADTERKMLSGQFSNTYLLGFQLIFTYVCSIYLWQRLWLKRCTPNVELVISIWMFFCFLITLCGFGTIWSLFMCANAMENTAEMALYKGIDLYYTCPEWKLLWDGMQFHRECCGVHGYKDWMKAAWMPADALEPIDNNGEPINCDEKKVTLAPYACCKHACNACFENYVPRVGSSGIPYLNLTQINVNGCFEQFYDSMWNIIYILLALVLIAFKIDLMICCLVKYILRKQKVNSDGCCNYGMTDDDGQPLVVVKCPPNVRCVSIETEEDGSACAPNESTEDMKDPCDCLSQEITHGYTIKQQVEMLDVPIKSSQNKSSKKQRPPKKDSIPSRKDYMPLKKDCNNKPRFVH